MAFDARKYIDKRLSLNAILKRQKRDPPKAPPSQRARTTRATVDSSKKVLQFLAKKKGSWRNVPSISSSVDVSTSWAYSLLARLETVGFVEKQIKQRRGHHQKEFRITPQGLASIDAQVPDTV